MAEYPVKPQYKDAFKRLIRRMSIKNFLSQCLSHFLFLIALYEFLLRVASGRHLRNYYLLQLFFTAYGKAFLIKRNQYPLAHTHRHETGESIIMK